MAVFRHPIGTFERQCRTAYDAAMRAFGVSSYVARAQGARFVVDTTDLIDRAIAREGIWEAEQLEDFAAICRARQVDYFLDIVANSGIYSVLFAIKDLGGEIIAFEPDPGNYARLLANLSLNGLDWKVRALPFAVGAQAGEVTLMQAGAANRGES